MDGFVGLVVELLHASGLRNASVHRERRLVAHPGYFRPTKLWHLLVLNKGHLVAVIEMKSQVGPSFRNNFNNRAEEAIRSACDLWTAYREGAFGEVPGLSWVG